VPVKLRTELFRYKDLDIIRLSWRIRLIFLDIIRILSNSCFIEFHTEDKAIRANVLVSIESELERTRFATIISNKYFKIISSIDLKSVPVKGYKLLVALS
jgi:hypothetical protein